MGPKPIDFHGIITLNASVVEQLYQYLDDKESQTCRLIMQAVHTAQGAPALDPSPSVHIKLSDTVEQLSKKVRNVALTHQPIINKEDWKVAAKEINQAYWNYLEILEESVIELFQQLEQIHIDDWREDLTHVVDAIKELLLHRLEDLKWALRRTENILRDYRWACEEQEGKWVPLRKILFFWKPLLDRSLSSNLYKSEKFLGFRYQKFSDRYTRFRSINSKLEHSLQKFSWYKIFSQLEPDSKEKFKKLYRLTKLWEVNAKARSFPQIETVRALRNLISPAKALELFKEYYSALHKALFNKSCEIKEKPNDVFDADKSMQAQEEILMHRGELHTLGSTVNKYREFLLRTDPNPYVRVRLGFPEWALGPEPAQTKQMRHLSLEIEKLDGIFEAFRQAIERKSVVPDATISQVKEDIDHVLHEMGQPLISKSLMRIRAERFVNLLQQVDELTTSNSEVVIFVGEMLNKALRNDWKHHVFFDIPDFHQLYTIHLGIIGPSGDRSHLNRMNKFKRFIQQISQWIKSNDTPRHMHEIELDMNDMKGYLQDFFAHVQRLSKEENLDKGKARRWIQDLGDDLLEYRYLFGSFFHNLHENKPEERLIRNQFLFVDQYFEAVESKLNEWKENILKVSENS